jgi:hypothetical protein
MPEGQKKKKKMGIEKKKNSNCGSHQVTMLQVGWLVGCSLAAKGQSLWLKTVQFVF